MLEPDPDIVVFIACIIFTVSFGRFVYVKLRDEEESYGYVEEEGEEREDYGEEEDEEEEEEHDHGAGGFGGERRLLVVYHGDTS